MNDAGNMRHDSEAVVLKLHEQELHNWGRDFGAALLAPGTIALSGELGAGKTTLVRAICEGYGVTDTVTSPTFALIHRYHSDRSPVFHIDLYRLSGARESAQLGIEEMFENFALILIEWPERAEGLLPRETTWIRLAHDDADGSLRSLTVE